MHELEKILELDSALDEEFARLPLDEATFSPPPTFSPIKQFGTQLPRHSLPEPKREHLKVTNLFDVIISRRSCREFDPEGCVTVEELSLLLYLTCGVTRVVHGIYEFREYPLRAAPSTGGLHGVDLYVILLKRLRDSSLGPGIYYYDYSSHQLVELKQCNPYPLIHAAVVENQPFALEVPLLFVYVMNLERGVWKYGRKYYKYLLVDVGVTAENTHLAAVALGLCSVMIGGFRRDIISELLGLERYEIPALLMAIGRSST